MVNIVPRHVWAPQPNVMVAFVGLEGDVQSLSQELKTQVSSKLGRALGFQIGSGGGGGGSGNDDSTNFHENKKSSTISARAMASITSHVLYRQRGMFYVEPLVVGLIPRLTDDGKPSLRPFLCAMDMIGAQSFSSSFVCSGVASQSLYGTAEAFWRPDLEPNELVEACGKAFQSALERDCLSGYGAMIYLISKNGIMEYDLSSRND